MTAPMSPRAARPQLRRSDLLGQALAQLADAYAYAQEVGTDTWTFAVEIACLHTQGLTDNDLRWLVLKGYVEHAGEVTPIGHDERIYRKTGRLRFCRRSCFILTQTGLALLDPSSGHDVAASLDVVAEPREESPSGSMRRACPSMLEESRAPLASAGPVSQPCWDADRQELRLGSHVVKQFKVPAPNQELILSAFQEENWPHRIDDPIPPGREIDPKRRLHDTINSLNRCQKSALIRFLGDGSGRGVRWVAVATVPSLSGTNGHAYAGMNGSSHS